MDQDLFTAAESGDVNKIKEFASGHGNHLKLTTGGNTILHLAIKFGKKNEVLEEILKVQRSLSHQKNKQGKTPMHVAAAAGNVDAVKILIDPIKTWNKDETSVELQENILLVEDNEGNTPLHTAVRNNRIDVVKLLMEERIPQLLLSTNKAQSSPLSIAIDEGFTEIARWMISEEPSSLDYTGPNNQTLLHIAILRANYLDDVVRDILNTKKKDLIDGLDKNNRNALHYAAVSGCDEIAKELANRNPSLAYQPDRNDKLPLHLAIKNNQLSALKTLLKGLPDLVEVVDKRNRNILHLAAKYGYEEMVSHILNLTEMEDLVNSPDNDGNTPLHLGAEHFHHHVVRVLSSKANIWAINNYGSNALQLAQQSTREREMETLKKQKKLVDNQKQGAEKIIKHKFSETQEELVEEQKQKAEKIKKQNILKQLTFKELTDAYATRAMDADDILAKSRFLRKEYIENSDKKGKEITDNILLIATLIASFTFAAAFAIPGGYEQEGPHKGQAVLVRKTAFQAFVITDAIAMTSSMTAAFLILLSRLNPDDDKFQKLDWPILLTWIGLVSMGLAFVTGLFVVLYNNKALAIVACAIGVTICASWYKSFVYLGTKIHDPKRK